MLAAIKEYRVLNHKKVLLVDDHPMVRTLFSVLVKDEGLDVCGEAATVVEAVALAKEYMPEVAVVDISLDGGNGLDLVRRLLNIVSDMSILICSSHEEALYAPRAIDAGAKGFINKKADAADIRSAIRAVKEGEVWLSAALRERGVGSDGAVKTGVSCLSNKELEVFRLIAQGSSSSDIAKQLGRSVKTIESHRENIKRKLELKSGGELVQFAVRWGLDQV